ncbi:hypothetical protein [Pontitalea aquivivens]|uniref:hypothetical protein n=1 Tax=Pontitalea aquivivens TaxID=3388663 RepID=UPI0039709B6B
MTRRPELHAVTSAQRDENLSHDRRCILVVETSQVPPLAMQGVSGAVATIIKFPDLDGALLARLQPDIVVAPLIGDRFDILDLAVELDRLGYRGALRAVTRPLPNADLVRREIAAQCPRIDFALIELPLV